MKNILLFLCLTVLLILQNQPVMAQLTAIPQTKSMNLNIDFAPMLQYSGGIEAGLDVKANNNIGLGISGGYLKKDEISNSVSTVIGHSARVGLRINYYFNEIFSNGFYFSNRIDYKKTISSSEQNKSLLFGSYQYEHNNITTLSLGASMGYLFTITNNITLDFGLGYLHNFHNWTETTKYRSYNYWDFNSSYDTNDSFSSSNTFIKMALGVTF